MKLKAAALIVTLALGLLAAPLPAEAEQARKVPVVGFLAMGSPTRDVWNLLEPFRQGLRDHGFVEGENILVEWRFAEKKAERLPALAAELVQLPVDVLVAPATRHVLAAKKATSTIPIVMVYVGDPVGIGVIKSYPRPGGKTVSRQEKGGNQSISEIPVRGSHQFRFRAIVRLHGGMTWE